MQKWVLQFTGPEKEFADEDPILQGNILNHVLSEKANKMKFIVSNFICSSRSQDEI